MATEKTLGNIATDVSAQKVGYDIVSYDPKEKRLRFIEVKGRADGAANVMLTCQKIITSLHEPDKYILAIVAIVEIDAGFAREPRYLRGALDTREPPFDQNAVQFNLKRLLERAEAPA